MRLESVGTNAQSLEDAPHGRQATIPNVPVGNQWRCFAGKGVLNMRFFASRQLGNCLSNYQEAYRQSEQVLTVDTMPKWL